MRWCTLWVVMMVAACQAAKTAGPDAAAAGAFVRVEIRSLPRGWGYAHKTVTADGVIQGGHMSGGPEAPSVHQSEERMSAADMAALRKLVAAVQLRRPTATTQPDQRTSSSRGLMIVLPGERDGLEFYTKEGEPFGAAELQAIWDLLIKYRAGAW